MPNKERIKLWVDALRSGKYKQGRGRLQNNRNQHCCLGVACDVAKENGLPLNVSLVGYGYKYDESTHILPISVQDWLGLDNNVCMLQGYSTSAIRLNDSSQSSFAEIADMIEKEFLQ